MIGLGSAAALMSGLKMIVLWFPRERLALINGFMIMLGSLGAVTATAPAEVLLDWIGWRGLFAVLAAASALAAILIYLVAPERVDSPSGSTKPATLKTIYSDQRFWRIAPCRQPVSGRRGHCSPCGRHLGFAISNGSIEQVSSASCS